MNAASLSTVLCKCFIGSSSRSILLYCGGGYKRIFVHSIPDRSVNGKLNDSRHEAIVSCGACLFTSLLLPVPNETASYRDNRMSEGFHYVAC